MAIPLPLAEKTKHCSGCRDDFYNRSGNSATGCCWLLEKAQVRWRWAINMQAPMDNRDNFRRVKVHTCYHGNGPYRDVYLKRLPLHLGGDWADERDKL